MYAVAKVERWHDNKFESNLSLVYIAYDSSVAPLGRGQCVVFVWLSEREWGWLCSEQTGVFWSGLTNNLVFHLDECGFAGSSSANFSELSDRLSPWSECTLLFFSIVCNVDLMFEHVRWYSALWELLGGLKRCFSKTTWPCGSCITYVFYMMCDQSVTWMISLIVWSGLGNETSWLGFGKDHGLDQIDISVLTLGFTCVRKSDYHKNQKSSVKLHVTIHLMSGTQHRLWRRTWGVWWNTEY